MSDAVAEKMDVDLKAELATRRQFEERVSKIEQELKDATRKCELLEEGNKAKAAELAKALQEVRIPSGLRGDPTGRTDDGW